jgi:glycosyltransferase involved in cell wall biosynthesis
LKVSAVVPAFNEEKLLPRSLPAIRSASMAFARRGWDFELVVCDNNSTDRTPIIAREHGAVVAHEPINQIARARNTGAAAATGDWLVFIDADSYPEEPLFEDLAEAISSGPVLGGGATVRLADAETRGHLWVNAWNRLSRCCRWAAGSFVFCEAEAFREIGGFSLEMFAGEEIDFSRRLKRLARRRGRKVVILHRHPQATSPRKLHLYSTWEMVRFFIRAAFRRKRVLGRREDCSIWYDGRR